MNKSFLILVLCASILVSCSENKRKQLPENGYFGLEFAKDSCIDAAQLPDYKLIQDSSDMLICGTIANYCKGEGCWISIENPKGKPIIVETLNKSFIVPFDIDHKKVRVKGKLVQVEPDSKYSFKIIATGVFIE